MNNITVCVSTYNRPEYTSKSLVSLASAWNGPVMIVDDGSDEKTLDIIQYLWTTDFCDLSENMYLQCVHQGIDFLVENFQNAKTEYIYITDNDVLYSEEMFQDKLIELYETIRFKDLIGTMFNTPSHPVVGQHSDELVYKKSIGGISVLINKDMFANALVHAYERNFVAPRSSWDWGLVDYAAQNKIKFLAYEESYIEHIGVHGLHSNTACYDRG